MNIKIIKQCFLIISLFACFAVALAAERLDGIVAYVNDDIITQNELNQMMSLLKQTGNAKGNLKQQAINELVDQALAWQMAKKANMRIDDKALDKIIADVAQRNHLTSAALLEKVKVSGMSPKQYREQLRRNVTVARFLQQHFASQVHISEQEVRAFMKHMPQADNEGVGVYHIAHIVWPVAKDADQQTWQSVQKSMQMIRSQLLAGRSFAQIQVDFPSIEEQDLGWRRLNEMPQIFVAPVTTMKTGQISQPVKAPNGLQLIRLIEKRGLENADTGVSREQARELLYQRKLKEAARPYFDGLKKQSYIRIVG